MAKIDVDNPFQLAQACQGVSMQLTTILEKSNDLVSRHNNEKDPTRVDLADVYALLNVVARATQLNLLAATHILRARVSADNQRIVGVVRN